MFCRRKKKKTIKSNISYYGVAVSAGIVYVNSIVQYKSL